MIEKNKYGIARWRIDSEEERRLARAADISPEGKHAYVEYYRINDAEYYAGGLPWIERTLNHFGVTAQGDKRQTIVEDMIYSLHRFGFSFEEYFQFNLIGKGVQVRESYITDKNRFEYYAKFNTPEGMELLENKAMALDRLKPYIGRDYMFVSNRGGVLQRDELDAFLSNHGDVIVKPLTGGCGRGIFLVKAGEMNADTLLKNLPSESAVIEERVVQSAEMAAFHPESLNTIRIIAFACKDGVHIGRSHFRIGRGSSVVDNAGQGGIFVSPDIETGQLMPKGYDELNGTYTSHPDSGLVFSEYAIPDWDEMIELTKKLMALVPECKYVGWDLAYTDKGWIVIEGNANAQYICQQIEAGHGLKSEWEKYIEMMYG